MIEKLLGPNWRTTLAGWIATLSAAIAMEPSLVSWLPPACAEDVIGIAKLVAVISGMSFASMAKDRSVSGNGTPQRPIQTNDSGVNFTA